MTMKDAFRSSHCLWNSVILMTFAILFVLLPTTTYSQVNTGPQIDLTAAEMEWLASSPTIMAPGFSDSPPYSFVEQGILQGYSIDYLKLIAAKSGLNIEFVNGKSWSEFMYMVEDGNLDMLHLVRRRDDVSQYMHYSQPYIDSKPAVLYGRDSAPKVNNVEEILDTTIAIERNTFEQRYLSKSYPDLNLMLVDSLDEGLVAILRGEADYFLCNPTVCDDYLFSSYMTNVSISGTLDVEALNTANQAYFAASKQLPHLLPVIEKTRNSLSEHELNELASIWLQSRRSNDDKKDMLSELETKWIEKNQQISFSSPLNAPPFSFVDDSGEYSGISEDLIRRFEQKYNVNVHLEKFENWEQSYTALIEKRVDFMPNISISNERKKQLLYSVPTLVYTQGFYTRPEHAVIDNMDSMAGHKIAVIRNTALTTRLKKEFPDLNYVLYNTVPDTIKAVSEGNADVTIGNEYIIDYHRTNLNIDNVVYRGDTEYSFNLAFAVNSSQPELVTLFNKMLADIDDNEIALMVSKWNNIKVIHRTDWISVVIWSSILVAIFLCFAVAFFIHTKKVSVKELSKIHNRLENAQRVTNVGNWDIDENRTYVDLSREASKIIGIAAGNSISQANYARLILNDDKTLYAQAWNKALKTGLLNVEYRIMLEAEVKWVNEIAELTFDENDDLASGLGTIQDIDFLKESEKQLIEQQRNLQTLTNKLLVVQEEERKRVARELHDDLSQRLAVVSINLAAVGTNLDSEESAKLAAVRKDLIRIAEDTHSLSRRLHPSILDDLGLVEALRSEFDSYKKREQINVNFMSTNQTIDYPNDKAISLFRISQEALRNIAKYSEASSVEVNLSIINERIILQISDDGIGFDTEAAMKSPGLGLTSMSERAKLIGGQFSIRSVDHQGTHIEVQVPLDGNS